MINLELENRIYLIISLIWLITSSVTLGFVLNPELIKEPIAVLLLLGSLMTILFLLILFIMWLINYSRKLEPVNFSDKIFTFMIAKITLNIIGILRLILITTYNNSIIELTTTKLAIAIYVIEIISYIILSMTKYRIFYSNNFPASIPLLV